MGLSTFQKRSKYVYHLADLGAPCFWLGPGKGIKGFQVTIFSRRVLDLEAPCSMGRRGGKDWEA